MIISLDISCLAYFPNMVKFGINLKKSWFISRQHHRQLVVGLGRCRSRHKPVIPQFIVGAGDNFLVCIVPIKLHNAFFKPYFGVYFDAKITFAQEKSGHSHLPFLLVMTSEFENLCLCESVFFAQTHPCFTELSDFRQTRPTHLFSK